MARAASFVRRLSFWTVVCGVALFLLPFPYAAASAAGIPQDIITSTTEGGSWVINEFHADPAADLAGDANGDGLSNPLQDEFIELFNNTGTSADISGWTLADNFGMRHQFPEGTVVPDSCAIVVFGGGTPVGVFGSSTAQVASSGALGLDNTGDTITLSNESTEIQSVSYGFEGNDDQSLTRNPDIDGGFEAHLTASALLNNRFSPGTRLDGSIFWGCPEDSPPQIVDSYPADGASGIPLTSTLSISFSEPVTLVETALDLTCSNSGDVPLQLSGGPVQFQLGLGSELVPGELCVLNVDREGVSDLDLEDPPDQMMADWQISFRADVTSLLLVNEVDSETPGIDDAEFIELYDGGYGGTRLDGLAIVLFSGHNDSAYAAFDLDGKQTDEHGFFLLGSSGVTVADMAMYDSLLQNGPDAVALYKAEAAQMPVGTAVTTDNLIDALVYDTGHAPDEGLLPLLLAGELQVNENGRFLDDFHSLQRCPNGSGGQRRTGTYWPDWPTPKKANTCIKDDAPLIVGSTPADGASDVFLASDLTVSFSEEVKVYNDWIDINCEHSGSHDVAVSGGNNQYSLHPLLPFSYAEQCRVTIFADKVCDLDSNDPPDHPDADYSWSFNTVPARHIVINEVDADTPGLDTAEFIELFDGGQGSTSLNELTIVLFNGTDDLSYEALDLSGQQTDEQGRFLIGSKAVPGVDLILPDRTLQNGPDAVALYTAQAEDFPIGSTITTANLLDALVYGTNDEPDDGLLVLLTAGQPQVDEDGRSNGDGDSSQRCPDGSGGQRYSESFLPNQPTPGKANKCTYDAAPYVASPSIADGAVDVPLDTSVTINFSEPVDLLEGWFDFVCQKAGAPEINIKQTGNQVSLKPQEALPYDDACTVTLLAGHVRDSDEDDPPDQMLADFVLHFQTVPLPPATHILINEMDADTPGDDTAEFIELFDGGAGSTLLDGLVVVLFNGSSALTYAAFDLDGYQTDDQGYFLLGNAAVAGVDHLLPNGSLQNGPDAVALFAANAGQFPNGTAVSSDNLLDALVYKTGDESASGLLPLLLAGEEFVDEDGRGEKDLHSNQRCPNGSGGQRRTGAFLQNMPTPKTGNFCVIDEAPKVSSHTPIADARNIAVDTNLSITFSEAVFLDAGSIQLLCTRSGDHDLALSGGPTAYTFKPDTPLSAGETCSAILFGDKVSDLDKNDPPDYMAGPFAWSFETVPIPVARHMVINEVDADTAGVDTAEFIELFDGGTGHTALDGLQIVLFNGADDQAYRRIDLAGYQTGLTGYFVIGGTAVPGIDLILPIGAIQNGPDAVALYARDELDESSPDENGLLDALVYHTNDEVDPGLQFLLLENEPQVNEGFWRDPAVDSNQRCPNGESSPRATAGYVQNQPTPGIVNNCVIDQPPGIVQVLPAGDAQDVALDSSLVVHFDEPVQTVEAWINLSCVENGPVDLVISGGPQQYTIQPASLAPFDSCTAAVGKEKVFDLDGYADTLSDDYVWHFSTGKPLSGVCGDEATPIHAVQGNGDSSPLLDSTGIIIEGIVVADYQGEQNLGGFFLQEESSDVDDDPFSSEGIFVADGPNTTEVTTGEKLRLKGDISEGDGLTSLVNVTTWQPCDTTTAVDPQPIMLPLDENLSWEALEGMLVTFSQKLTVIDNDRWGSEGIIGLASERLYFPTMITAPGPLAQDAAKNNRLLRIALDDGSKAINPLPYPPYLGLGNTLRLGDTAENISGVVTEARGGYRIQPTKPVTFNRDNPRPSLASPIPGRTRVAHVNAAGFFNGDGQGNGFLPGHGAGSAVAYQRQREKLISTLLALDAGVIGLTGIENDGYGKGSAVQDLLNALNDAAETEEAYRVVEDSGGEQVGFADTAVLIYRQDIVSPSGDPLALSEYPFEQHSRRPLGQHFVAIASGQEITVIVTQFPERGNCPTEGDPNADQGDWQACWNKLRTEAASNLAKWVLKLQADSGNEMLVIGDLNSYANEEPVQVLETTGLANVEQQDRDEGSVYSAVLNGEAGTLNYGFVTAGLESKVALVQRWHINADEPAALDYRETNQPLLYAPGPYRSATQDPLVIDLSPTGLSAGFTSSSPVWIGEVVHFTNLSHGPQPLTHEWDFGDGSPLSNEIEPQQTFEQVGTYTVTLTVKTSWGETAVYSAPVEVLPGHIYLPLSTS